MEKRPFVLVKRPNNYTPHYSVTTLRSVTILLKKNFPNELRYCRRSNRSRSSTEILYLLSIPYLYTKTDL